LQQAALDFDAALARLADHLRERLRLAILQLADIPTNSWRAASKTST
jgi:hypothetical protein